MTAAVERPAGWFAAPAKAGGRPGRSPRAAFTLLEILLALALLALLISATVSLSSGLVGDTAVTAEDMFWKGLTEARKEALTSQQEVRLSFDAKTKAFVVATDAGVAQTLPVTTAVDKLTVDFLPLQKTNNIVLIGGELVETQGLPFVTFYDDGTCTPFRVQFRHNAAASFITIDPWTCAEMLEVKK